MSTMCLLLCIGMHASVDVSDCAVDRKLVLCLVASNAEGGQE